MFNVTASPPPLVSLAVVVPGPASSNGNLNLRLWAQAVSASGSAHAPIRAASLIQFLYREYLLLEEDNIGGVGFCL
jgi:hypothetical protein